jgi:RNA polymerase primary sigma factor
MDAPITEGEEGSMIDLMRSEHIPNPDESLIYESLRKEIERTLATLTPRESDVIRLFFGLDGRPAMTLEEIGEQFELTRERVRQIKEKALRRLKQQSRSRLLKAYLG